ncbi:hypothetical protein Gogos_011626 [Gossypium gossypioides]|uniref:Uncharacterized protein n=1 Tax=Gossypium gossypioides TaxID=34282 RepID=A0A7J9BPZ3_GOSGO|nr:hypothetical protein [Gossypium gossypioides]
MVSRKQQHTIEALINFDANHFSNPEVERLYLQIIGWSSIQEWKISVDCAALDLRQPLDIRRNANVHTELQAKDVFFTLDHNLMRTNGSSHVSFQTIHTTNWERNWRQHTSWMMRLKDMPNLERKMCWMQDMSDILIHLVQQNGWSTPMPLPDMFVRFLLLGEEEDNEKYSEPNSD